MLPPLTTIALAADATRLIPFLDDGGTMTHPLPPSFLVLTGRGGTKATALRVGGRAFRVEVRPTPQGLSLFADENGDGRIAPGERVVWSRRDGTLPDGSRASAYAGQVSIHTVGFTGRYGVRMLTSDTKGPDFARVRDRLAVTPMFGYSGRATFGGKAYRIAIRGGDPTQAALFIDRDGDGVFGTVPAELFALGKPFSLDGRSYRVSTFQPDRLRIAFAPSATRVAEVPMPADLRVGRVVPPVAGRTLGGKALTFPKSFPGKLVLLDVWATWCGPCKGEIPFMKAAYAKYRARGFEICSMSIDDPGMRGTVEAFTRANGMAWTQVFQGQGWASPVCQRYNVHGIPFMLLVDGTTGRILAREDALRGPGVLDSTVASALARRR